MPFEGALLMMSNCESVVDAFDCGDIGLLAFERVTGTPLDGMSW